MSNEIFITGIPTSGKTYLAKKLASIVDGIVVSTDDMRVEMSRYSQYKKWVDFYINLDEKEYYEKTSPDEQWNNLVQQSDAMWPFILEKINTYSNHEKPVIFEGVNILPHLAKKDLSFSGVVLIGNNKEEVYERVKENHRWGNTEELWRLESNSFFDIERPKYKEEALKHGYDVFETTEDAFESCIKRLRRENSRFVG